MKLWEYLKEKMQPYANKVAFARSGITYGELVGLESGTGTGKLRLCAGRTRGEQAISILRCIAAGDVAVPAAEEYGKVQYERIAEIVNKGTERYSDLAFLMFTSGTTGTPKGVMLTDENIITNLEYISSYFRVESAKSICIARPLLHIAVLTGEFLYALCCGLTIYFYEEPLMPQRLNRFLRGNGIDVFCATPTLYRALARVDADAFPVKVGALSGEILSAEDAKRLQNSFPETKFYNVYGLTEHSPRVSALLPEEFTKRSGSVGKPIGEVEMRIERGELLVKSPCVMKGYYKDEAATAQKIQNGWLYTGDRAHIDNDGYFYIDGRADDMIIRAGLNIYPAEIENAAKKCERVTDCIAFSEKNTDGQTMIVLKYAGEAEPAEVREVLVRELNPHAMPNKILKTGMLAYTPSMKILRK